MKPILFNTDMVRAILEGRKTVTRRVVKPQPFAVKQDENAPCWYGHFVSESGKVLLDKPPYCPGEILYVRETFRIDYLSNIPGTGHIHYKADGSYSDFSFMPERYEMMRRAQLKPGWRPNENMPREAARIFLRVTDVRVERLQEMPPYDIAFDGFRKQKDFIALWNSTIKSADRAIYGWDANPWVWVIQFERCERPKEVCPLGGAGEGGRLT